MIKKYKLDAFDSLVSADDGYLVYYDDYQKLEAENRRLRRAFQGDVGSLADAVAENKRLRQALEAILNRTSDYHAENVRSMKYLAKAALDES